MLCTNYTNLRNSKDFSHLASIYSEAENIYIFSSLIYRYVT